MTYDIRDTMIEAFLDDLREQADEEGATILSSNETRHYIQYDGIIDLKSLAAVALDAMQIHLANEPRTKAETALIEFAEGKALEMRDNGFLHASDRAIPREILQAFVEELK